MAATEIAMSIKSFKHVAVMLPPTRSVLLRAGHGIGKSKVIRQVSAIIRQQLIALMEKEGTLTFDRKVIDLTKYRNLVASGGFYPVIDIRLGQRTEGDVIGLPSTDGKVTRFNPPNWYHMACEMPCCLFLDELNRATLEVMQAAFQIALDHELDLNKLHPLTRVYAAINTGAQYQVTEMDPALLSRFYVIDLMPDVSEFCDWARDTDPEQGGNLHPFIPDFIKANDKWLYPPKNAEPNTQHPTPRGWEFVNEALVHAGLIEVPSNEIFWQIARGFVGNEAATAFRDYCLTHNIQVSGDDIVNRFHKDDVKAKVERQSHERRNGLIEKIAEYVTTNLDTLNDTQGKNITAFFKILDEEHRIALWSKLTSKGIDKIGLAKSIHKYCAADVLAVFGVPMGESGIGVVPNIPGIFKAPAKTSAEASKPKNQP